MLDSGPQRTPLPLRWNHPAITAAAHRIGVTDVAEILGSPLPPEPSYAQMSLLVALLPIAFSETVDASVSGVDLDSSPQRAGAAPLPERSFVDPAVTPGTIIPAEPSAARRMADAHDRITAALRGDPSVVEGRPEPTRGMVPGRHVGAGVRGT